MAGKKINSDKGSFTAEVCYNKTIGNNFYCLCIEFEGAGAEAFSKTKPGQFAQLDLSNQALPARESIPDNLLDKSERKILLRRPFSFCDITTIEGKCRVEILYFVLGPATLRMKTLREGDLLSVIGPLGNGFSLVQKKKTAILLSGGTGIGPLMHLTKALTEKTNLNLISFIGARGIEQLPFEKKQVDTEQTLFKFSKYDIETNISTDDGSVGFQGFVTECFLDWLDKSDLDSKDIIIYSCGPETMLAKTAEIAKDKKIDCLISTERRMACGIGLCQSCAVECKVDGTNETIYKMCCKDGPVFDSQEVVFNL